MFFFLIFSLISFSFFVFVFLFTFFFFTFCIESLSAGTGCSTSV